MDKPVTVAFKTDNSACAGASTVFTIDGVDLAHVARRLRIDVLSSQGATVEVDVVARHGMDVTFPALVTIQVMVIEGFVLVAEPQADGSTRCRAEREQPNPKLQTVPPNREIREGDKA